MKYENNYKNKNIIKMKYLELVQKFDDKEKKDRNFVIYNGNKTISYRKRLDASRNVFKKFENIVFVKLD